MPALLITQCLQEDFVGPLSTHAPVPNRLHVGHREAARLLGSDPSRGPLAQLMTWARTQSTPDGDPSNGLTILHVRDWHDPDEPLQAEHLATFGAHCHRDSPGARLVLDLDEGVDGGRERFVDATTLNDLEDANLGVEVQRCVEAARAAGAPLRVGVIGVWTDAKVSFLLYELATRLRIRDLATCSALTASASRTQHFNALEQLRRLLGVEVFDSVGAFAQWLNPRATPPAIRVPTPGNRPRIRPATIQPPLANDDENLLAYLYREAAELELTPLSGGFSGARVFAVQARDPLGHELAPSVAKLGPRALIGTERAAFERVEDVLGNDAPAIRGFADQGERAGIKYAYAAMGAGHVRTFKSLVESEASTAELERVLDTVFGAILGRFARVAQSERLQLLRAYGFSPRHATSVGEHARAAAGHHADERRRAERLQRFYAEELADQLDEDERGASFHRIAYVHGDLNGANILLDPRDNVWLIDFFHTRRAHVLQDLVKLENDLLYLMTPLQSADELDHARTFTDALLDMEDLRVAPRGDVEPWPSCPVADQPALARAWTLVGNLRRHAASYLDGDPVQRQRHVAALRYAAHTLSFDEASPLQKRWALHASARLCDRLTD